MINFIIGEDQKLMMKKIVDIIDKTMFNQPFDYEKHCFFDYDKDFFKKSNQLLGLKIYILDIHMKSKSGLDVARIIREDDLNSVIIFSTVDKDKGYEVLRNEFLSLTFIIKNEEYEKRLQSAIKKSLKVIDKEKYLILKNQNSVYQIPLTDIIYIYREKLKRKTIVVTDYASIVINQPLLFFEKKLNCHFKKSHRACIVNQQRILQIDRKHHEIIFDNKQKTNLMRRDFNVIE